MIYIPAGTSRLETRSAELQALSCNVESSGFSLCEANCADDVWRAACVCANVASHITGCDVVMGLHSTSCKGRSCQSNTDHQLKHVGARSPEEMMLDLTSAAVMTPRSRIGRCSADRII